MMIIVFLNFYIYTSHKVTITTTTSDLETLKHSVSNCQLLTSPLFLTLRSSSSSSSSSPPTCSKFPVCDGSQSAAIDVIILIAVITACGFLFFPYAKLITLKSVEIFSDVSVLVKQEIQQNPVVYGSLALSIFCAGISTWLVVLLCTMQRCGKPNCKGLRKAVEFDIQLETEDCLKSSNNNNNNNGRSNGRSKRGMMELPRVHHRELEAELKKMAPPNGRAVLVFRARCGCSVRRLVVSGPKKQQRKIKK
uniref:60S ribosomal protein L34 n=1 Tax=Noccaea caerulescens TaxID=107243 RepID=A0A1J3IDF7_NOCCA